MRKIASDAEIYTAFRNWTQLLIVSNGGLKDSYVIYSGKLVTPELRSLSEGSGPVDGSTTQSSSARAELFDLGSPLSYIWEYSKYYSVPICGKIKWLCNSKATLAQVEKTVWKGSKQRSQPNNVDIVSLIADEILILHRPFRSRWVKAHQDDDQRYDSLSPRAKLNVDVDRLVTRHREKSTKNQSCQSVDHFPTTNVSISINGERITGDFDKTLRRHINGSYLRVYYCSIKGWSNKTYDSIDWYMFGRHMKSVPANKEANNSKQLHDWLPIGTQRFYRAGSWEETFKLCLACHAVTETANHMYVCPKKQSHRYKRLLQLHAHFRERGHPTGKILYRCIEQWTADQDRELDPDSRHQPIPMTSSTIYRARYGRPSTHWLESGTQRLSKYPLEMTVRTRRNYTGQSTWRYWRNQDAHLYEDP